MSNQFTTRSILSTAVVSSDMTQLAVSDDEETLQLALAVAEAVEDRKGADVILLRVTDVCYLADYFVIATGFSNVQIRAIAQSVQDRVIDDWQRYPQRVEGISEGSWIVLDYGEVIAHVFMPHERDFYNLEAFWGHAERVQYPASKV